MSLEPLRGIRVVDLTSSLAGPEALCLEEKRRICATERGLPR
jgi:hypothetical protein